MKLRFRNPDKPDDVARRAFLDQLRDPLPALPSLANMKFSPGVPLWSAAFETVIERTIPEDAVWIGWRYFAFDENDAVAADVLAHGVQPTASRIFGGPAVSATLEALAHAEDFAGNASVDTRILNVPSVFFTGIWVATSSPRCIQVEADGQLIDWEAAELFEEIGRRADDRIMARKNAPAPEVSPDDEDEPAG